MADRIAAGDPVKHIVADLAERGVLTVTGRTSWAPRTVTRAVQSPRMIGKVEVDGQLVDDPQFPAILDVEVWEKVRALFADESREKFRSPRRRESLLSGLLSCSLCGSPMYAAAQNYGCTGCSKVYVRRQLADTEVSERVLVRITSGPWLDAMREATALGAEYFDEQVADADGRMVVLAETFGGAGDRPAFDAGVAAARQARADAERSARMLRAVDMSKLSTPEEIVEWWADEASKDDQRAVIEAVVEKVVVEPRSVKDRVQIVFRGDGE